MGCMFDEQHLRLQHVRLSVRFLTMPTNLTPVFMQPPLLFLNCFSSGGMFIYGTAVCADGPNTMKNEE